MATPSKRGFFVESVGPAEIIDSFTCEQFAMAEEARNADEVSEEEESCCSV